ncbi:MAG: sulfurtransferase TusA family protein [Anaerovorax sp.]
MSAKKIDARGHSCPEPVLMAKKAISQSANEIEIILDSHTAVQNVTRFCQNHGFTVDVKETKGEFLLKAKK